LLNRTAAFLYSTAGPAGALNDIKSGKNVGYTCNNSAVAFSAAAGWDPTSGLLIFSSARWIRLISHPPPGWGSPNFPKLLAAAKTVKSSS
jgi:hypothetical protein